MTVEGAVCRATTTTGGLRPMPRTRHLVALLAGAALLVVTAVLPVDVAAAASSWPAKPTGVRVAAVGTHAVTVTADRAANTTGYRLWVSPVKNDLWVSTLGTPSAVRRVLTSTSPRFEVTDLPYKAAPYYYRLATMKSGHLLYSPIYAVSLRPTAPVVTATSGTGGLALTWRSLTATGFVVVQSTDPSMQVQRKVYTLRDMNTQFTPYGLTRGVTYWFQVRALNGLTVSPYSPPTSAVAQTGELRMRVMTYNLLILTADGARGGGGAGEVVASWNASRKAAAAALVRGSAPDVIAVQEGSAYTAGWNSARQVDSLASALGAQYTVARTQGLATDPDYVLTGVHIVYRNTAYAAVGNGGHWYLNDAHRYAAYQVLRHRTTGAEVLVVSAHLTTNRGTQYDALRRQQTQLIVDNARALAAGQGGIPVVYAGDVGTVHMSWQPYDPAGIVMRSAHGADAFDVAQVRTNHRYSSVNQYRRVPILDAGSVDRIFASPGVAVRSWNELLRLSDGRFVGVIPSDHNPVVADLGVPYS
jgi:endonuclease/exonuclease/phosphatase family metal-dependent hydrolase